MTNSTTTNAYPVSHETDTTIAEIAGDGHIQFWAGQTGQNRVFAGLCHIQDVGNTRRR
jgi:hypothetical protein